MRAVDENRSGELIAAKLHNGCYRMLLGDAEEETSKQQIDIICGYCSLNICPPLLGRYKEAVNPEEPGPDGRRGCAKQASEQTKAESL